MSMGDFCRCTPSEFRAAWNAWNTMRESRERGTWERMRMQCLCTLQPWSKKKLEARDVMRFPWDEKPAHEAEEIGKEELMRRYREAKQAAGLK